MFECLSVCRRKGTGGCEFEFGHLEFQVHLRQLSEMSSRQMCVYIVMEPTRDINL